MRTLLVMPSQDEAYEKVKSLVKKFKALSASERRHYNEASTRQSFILPLFGLEALGWNIEDASEVSPEEKVSRGWVDFSFRISGIPRLFLETKKLDEDLSKSKWVKQAIDYAWTKGVTWALLSDFERLRVFNAEWRETEPARAQFIDFSVDTYLSKFENLWWLSRIETERGTLDREAEKFGNKIKKEPVNVHLFDDLKSWRAALYRVLLNYNKEYQPTEIDKAVLHILNRLIFIRTAEDREVEPGRLLPLLRELAEEKRLTQLPRELSKLFREFDKTYNSELFAPHFSEKLDGLPEPFRVMIEGLYERQGHYVRYNFNAIDADVLGTVYEQYLGYVVSIPKDTEPNKPKYARKKVVSVSELEAQKRTQRKSHGIYYTPTFVVKYIVQQTLGNYLQEHGYNPSHPVRVLDMACGSGSFLIEAFEVFDRYVAHARAQVHGRSTGVQDYARQMEILTRCIYGVDKDEQAVEVARLNLMLKALYTRDKLLMLENIRAGDSLISGTDDELKEVFGKDWKEKRAFNWGEQFPEAIANDGFDVIIGNPPYFNIESLGKDSSDASWIKSHYPEIWMDKSDILFYFISRAIHLLRGRMAFIVSRSFLGADKAQLLRRFILEHCVIETVIDFHDFKVFSDASISTAIIVLRLEPDAKHRVETITRIAKVHIKDGDGTELMRSIEKRLSEPGEYAGKQFSVFDYPQSKLDKKTWAFAPAKRDALYVRIDGNHSLLSEVCFVGEGMQTGANDVFEVDKSAIRKLNLEKEWLRKHSANSDIRRYLIEHSETWLIWIEEAETFQECPGNISAYLKSKSAELKKRAAYERGNCEWYKFTWPLHKEWYGQPKIIVPYRAPENRFALDDQAEYVGLTDTTVVFKRTDDRHDLRYYLALLNSRLLNFRFRGIGKMTGSGMYEYFKNSIGQLPIRSINFSDTADKRKYDSIVKLVEKMLELQKEYAALEVDYDNKRPSIQRQINKTDSEIDALIYDLYGLTDEEIAIVERRVAVHQKTSRAIDYIPSGGKYAKELMGINEE